jgi:TP901 family phage tail tape measure protein
MAVVVSIVSQFNDRELKRAIRSLDDFKRASAIAGGGVAGNLQVAGKALQSVGSQASAAGRSMTLGMTLPLTLLGKSAITSAAQFETAMAQVGVATDATKPQLQKLSDLALQMGADTIFSAGEAGDAMLELAKAGFSPAQIEAGALKSTLDLAAASGMSLAEAAVVTGAGMNTFSLAAEDSTQIVDALAGAANSSAADVSDLAMSLQQVGQQATASGLSLQETTGALAAFADAGIRGSDAGTSLKVFLQRLVPSSEEASKTMELLGLDFFDAQGNMKSLAEVAQILQTQMKGMTQEQRLTTMQVIFGSDATRAANILYQEGAAGIEKYVKASTEQGAASKMAAARMEGLSGSLEQLRGSLETASIKIGQALAPAVEDVAGKITDLTNKFTDLSPETQETIVKVLALTAAMGPAVWIGGKFASTLGTIFNGAGMAINGLKGTYTALMQVKDGMTQAGAAQSAFANNWVKLGGALRSGAEWLGTNTKKLALQTLGWIRDTAALVAHTVAQKAAAVASKVMAAGQWLLNAALTANPIGLVVAGIAALIAGFVLAYNKSETFRNIVDKLWAALKAGGGIVKDAFGAIGNTIKGYINIWIRFLNFLISGLNKIKFTIPDIPGLPNRGKTFGVSIPSIPYLAKGGIVEQPTLAVIGEAGPEAVVPLSRGANYGMGSVTFGAGAVVVNVGGGANTMDVRQAVRDGIDEALTRISLDARRMRR